MRMIRNIAIGLLPLMAAACGSDSDDSFTPDYTLTIDADTTISVTVDATRQHQTIDGFGSSDAWNMDYVGRYWTDAAKSGIAKLLFSQNISNGQPDGIGLSTWRVNLGGGTAGQGDASRIDKPERRAECFLTESGSYDWTQAAGQQYFMQKAKEYGVKDFVLFSNTPPIYYTKNGLGNSDEGAYANLKDDCYDDFAAFLATTARHFSDQGYNISFISPVNEPQYNWTDGQEGSGWQNAEVARLTRELDAQLTAQGLADTKILLGEAGQWSYIYETDGGVGAGRSNVAEDLFGPSSANYVGSLAHVPDVICGHSYWQDRSWSELQTTRAKAYDKATALGLRLYQSEWCHMSEQYEAISSYGAASYMDLALIMSQVIHNDLTVGNMSSWCYWTSCERERWDQKSRFYLIRLTPEGGDYGELTGSGTYTASKNLWTLGNYSLFVRPGYKRVEVSVPVSGNRLFASAYVSEASDRLVVVYTNMMDKSVKVESSFNAGGKTAKNLREYVTSSSRDLKLASDYETGIIPARSVATMVYDLE